MLVMISYDVTDDRKRLRLMNLLKDYGTRVQKSVFECHISPSTYERIKKEIEEIIDRKRDRVRYYRICSSCSDRIEISGWGEYTDDEEFILI